MAIHDIEESVFDTLAGRKELIAKIHNVIASKNPLKNIDNDSNIFDNISLPKIIITNNFEENKISDTAILEKENSDLKESIKTLQSEIDQLKSKLSQSENTIKKLKIRSKIDQEQFSILEKTDEKSKEKSSIIIDKLEKQINSRHEHIISLKDDIDSLEEIIRHSFILPSYKKEKFKKKTNEKHS